MNFKSATFCVLSLTLISLSPDVFAAKKTPMEEIKLLQASLLKNRNSVDSLLNTKAHQINKETDAMISGPGAGNYTMKQPLYGAIRQMMLKAVETEQQPGVFSGPDAMENLLKGYRMTEQDRVEVITNPTEKIYSLAVLNPENLATLKQANAVMKKEVDREDDLLTRMSRYIELSMSGKRYVTYKEAETLSNQIYKMNSDLQEIEELAIKLPTKDQKAVETFRSNISEWLNKKLVFTEINKKGFTASIDLDSMVSLSHNDIDAALLNKNYTPANISVQLKNAIKMYVTERQQRQRWDDFAFYTQEGYRNSSQKMSVKELNDLQVVVSADRLTAVISTKKFSFTNKLNYPRVAKLFFSQEGKAFYDHNSQLYTDYYNPNSSIVRATLKLVQGHEIQMKNIYKNFGLEKFGTDLGKVELTVK